MSANATPTLHIDFETRSRCDLLACGAYVYAAHSSTEVLCLGWAFDDEEPALWLPGQPFPERVRAHFALGARASIHAHNANFERLIVAHVLSDYEGAPPQPPLEAWYCTATQARARALPGSLDDLARCLGGPQKKDRRGKELIKLLSIPQKDTGEFREDAALLEEMYAYCLQDVRVERAVSKMSPPLSEREHRDYVVSEMINDAGLLVDVPFAKAAMEYADAEMEEINVALAKITEGKITSAKQFQALKDLMVPYMEADDRIRKAMTRVETDRREGTEKRRIVLDNDARGKLLAIAADEPDFLPPHIVEMLELTDAAGKSSVAKFGNMVLRAGADGRVRGAYIASGAGQTGRFSSVGLQLHNFGRNCAADPAEMRARVLAGLPLDNVMADLASMLRPAIQSAPGNTLVWGDWSAIEARVLPWLGGGEAVLGIFRTNDADPSLPDIYKVEAAALFGVLADDVTKDQRQLGKVEVLSCFGPHTCVLTSTGIKDIVAVSRNDLLWDGVEWVRHRGVVARGVRRVVDVDGIEVTPDHLVKTGRTWRPARGLVFSGAALRRALATGSENLPLLGTNMGLPAASEWWSSGVRAGQNRIMSTYRTFKTGARRGAIPAQRSKLGIGVSTTGGTPISSRMTRCGGVSGGGYPRASTGATTPTTAHSNTMARGVLPCSGSGASREGLSWPTSQPYRALTTRRLNLTASTSTRGMSQETSVLFPEAQTCETAGRSLTLKPASGSLKTVYDIAHAGPRNRFTVLTNSGALLVHNCGYQ